LLLFAANIRSHFYYQGPNYSFLIGISLYCIVTGIGLLKVRKWAVLLLFLPGAFTIVIFYMAWTKGARVPLPWSVLNYGFLATLVGIPAIMLRHWNQLRW
jgi:hypothetical protein